LGWIIYGNTGKYIFAVNYLMKGWFTQDDVSEVLEGIKPLNDEEIAE